MEQEATVYKLKDMSKLTGEMLLKTLLFLIENGTEKFQNKMLNPNITGETSWSKFMATDASKTVKEFRSNELNLERLKEYLAAYKIGFALEELKEGQTSLVFYVKDQELVSQAFQNTLEEIVDPDKSEELCDKLILSPKNMNLKQRLNHYKNVVREKIAKNALASKKTISKKIKGEREK